MADTVDGFCALGTVRLHRLLTFQLDFQSQKLLQVPKMVIFGDKCRYLSMKKMSYDFVGLIEVRDDPFVSVCMLGLTLIAVVVVEIWGEIFLVSGIWWRSQREEWYGGRSSYSIVL